MTKTPIHANDHISRLRRSLRQLGFHLRPGIRLRDAWRAIKYHARPNQKPSPYALSKVEMEAHHEETRRWVSWMAGVELPKGYIPGVGRGNQDYGFLEETHLYEGTFGNVGRPMCLRGWNRYHGTAYSIFRNNVGDAGICPVCIERAQKKLPPVPPTDEARLLGLHPIQHWLMNRHWSLWHRLPSGIKGTPIEPEYSPLNPALPLIEEFFVLEEDDDNDE